MYRKSSSVWELSDTQLKGMSLAKVEQMLATNCMNVQELTCDMPIVKWYRQHWIQYYSIVTTRKLHPKGHYKIPPVFRLQAGTVYLMRQLDNVAVFPLLARRSFSQSAGHLPVIALDVHTHTPTVNWCGRQHWGMQEKIGPFFVSIFEFTSRKSRKN